MPDYTIHVTADDSGTMYAIVINDKEVKRQVVKFAPGMNLPENALSVALSDILVRIDRAKKLPETFSVSIPELLYDDTVFDKVSLFGGVELRILTKGEI